MTTPRTTTNPGRMTSASQATFCWACRLRKRAWFSGSFGRIEMRSASSASQATAFRKKSWLPWMPRREFEAKSESPTATTRPSGAFGSSGAGDGAGEAAGDGAGDGVGVGAGVGPLTVATAASEIGPIRSLPSSNLIGPLRPRSVSAHDRSDVFTRSCAVTPSTVPFPACTLRAAPKTVDRRKFWVIGWYG